MFQSDALAFSPEPYSSLKLNVRELALIDVGFLEMKIVCSSRLLIELQIAIFFGRQGWFNNYS